MATVEITYAPVGPMLENGQDLGGNRIYPLSHSLAIAPPAEFSNYVGSGSGALISPPVAAQVATTGVGGDGTFGAALRKPWGKDSPLPWVVFGLVGALVAMHVVHYK